MNNVIFTYSQESALSAGQSGFINESGAYVFTISEAKYVANPSGSKSLEFSVETDDGRKANYLNIYTVKRDGTPNTHGVNMINAIMGCTGVNQLTMAMKDVNTQIAPELTGKRIGLVLQKTLKTKDNGQETYSFDIRIPFVALTKQTLQEKVEAKPAEIIEKMVATLHDKDERKKGTQQSSQYPGDESFFNPSSEF